MPPLINTTISQSAQIVSIEFLNGPTIPPLTRDEAEALLEALENALPQMAVKP